MENCKVKIIFIGTPEFGAIILEKLMANGYSPVAVITASDKPAGRKQIITPPPTKISAQKYNIPVLQPEILANYKLEITNYKPDLIVVAAYGQILPQEILEIPKHGCLNVHPSLLPKYRGATPIQSAILNGDKETGVTIMLMDEGMDTGPILTQRKTIIGPQETAKQLHDRLAQLGSELLIDVIPDWVNGKIEPILQNEKEATYTKILTRNDGEIDWEKSPQEIDRQVRAYNPWPGTFAFWKRKKKTIQLKILQTGLEKNKLIIKTVQPEGKKPMSFQDFLRGNPNFKIPYVNSH